MNDAEGDPPAADPGAEAGASAPSAAAAQDGAAAASWRLPSERLHRRVIAYWYASDVARALALTTFLWFGATYLSHREAERAWMPTAALIVGGALLLSALILPAWSYARWRFSVDGQLLVMRHGVLFVEERLVPVPRMQHVDLMRGPIERLFGLATLVVFTAGNEGSAFRVPGLLRSRAESLRDTILRARGHDGI